MFHLSIRFFVGVATSCTPPAQTDTQNQHPTISFVYNCVLLAQWSGLLLQALGRFTSPVEVDYRVIGVSFRLQFQPSVFHIPSLLIPRDQECSSQLPTSHNSTLSLFRKIIFTAAKVLAPWLGGHGRGRGLMLYPIN